MTTLLPRLADLMWSMRRCGCSGWPHAPWCPKSREYEAFIARRDAWRRAHEWMGRP